MKFIFWIIHILKCLRRLFILFIYISIEVFHQENIYHFHAEKVSILCLSSRIAEILLSARISFFFFFFSDLTL